MRWSLNEKPVLVIALIVSLVFCFDFFNLDRLSYKTACSAVNAVFDVTCTDYYDMPIWQVAGVFGSLAALYFAYRAIMLSNSQLEAEQTPYVVMKNQVVMADNNQRMHSVMFENIGKGLAANITLTADPEGKISIIESSNPHTHNLGSGQFNNGWAVNESRAIEGLKFQGIDVKNHIIIEIPDENAVSNVDKCDFYLYFWYEDQTGKKYVTQVKIRHSGHFLKVMENNVRRL